MQPANTLKIETLKDGWCDKDHILLHACFQLLNDFVEKELLVNNFVDWNADELHRNARKEIEDLYAWWQDRKNDEVMDKSLSFDLDREIYLKDNEMLKRMIDVRMFLWT